jgi:alkyl hydroperoxide reductase subunit AhpF
VPFLEVLSQIKNAPYSLSPDIQKGLDQIEIPVNLKLYIALQCPHCPRVVRTVFPLAFENKAIKLHIIDGTLFPDQSGKDLVMSAPCLILDNGFRWTGSVHSQEITKMIINRDASQLSPATLINILEQGDVS